MISAIILTKNEEKNIVDCLESARWCDEIVVIDDYSEDKTVEIAKKMGAKVFKHSLGGNFSNQRNFGLQMARSGWALFVDADERLTRGLKNEIQKITSSQILLEHKLCGFYVRRIDVLWGKELNYGETGSIKLLRLAKRGKGVWAGKVHERWEIEGLIGKLKNPLLHYPHQTISEFLKKINFYTDIRAQDLYSKKIKVYFASIFLYPLGKFILNFFIKRGFLDGIPGLIVAILMSFHSFLVRGKAYVQSRKDIIKHS